MYNLHHDATSPITNGLERRAKVKGIEGAGPNDVARR
jgi:hypothetical protein